MPRRTQEDRRLAVIGKAEMQAFMCEISSNEGSNATPESRYAYYRRCQVFRSGGQQCKAPAEKGTHICYAHAAQRALRERRVRERRAVLAEVAMRMRAKGRVEFEVADIGTDFNAIQVTIAVAAHALIDGRIDCKTAGKLLWQLQTAARLLWLYRQALQRTAPSESEQLPKLRVLSKSPKMGTAIAMNAVEKSTVTMAFEKAA